MTGVSTYVVNAEEKIRSGVACVGSVKRSISYPVNSGSVFAAQVKVIFCTPAVALKLLGAAKPLVVTDTGWDRGPALPA